MNLLQIIVICCVCVAIISLASFICSCCLRTIQRYPGDSDCSSSLEDDLHSTTDSEAPLLDPSDYNYGAIAPTVDGLSDGRFRPTPFRQAEFVVRSEAPPKYDDLFGSRASPAPIGCASSEGFLITHPASPDDSFRPFQRQ
eukprot:sb/3474214/